MVFPLVLEIQSPKPEYLNQPPHTIFRNFGLQFYNLIKIVWFVVWFVPQAQPAPGYLGAAGHARECRKQYYLHIDLHSDSWWKNGILLLFIFSNRVTVETKHPFVFCSFDFCVRHCSLFWIVSDCAVFLVFIGFWIFPLQRKLICVCLLPQWWYRRNSKEFTTVIMCIGISTSSTKYLSNP